MTRFLKTSLFTSLLLLVLTCNGSAQQRVLITGIVRDAASREPVTGATVRLENGSRGTFTSRSGTFRLPLEPGRHRVVISSIGFESKTVTISTDAARVEVALTAAAVQLSGISVTADLTADEVVRNAIARKEQNLARLRTFKGLLYSKFTVDTEGNVFGALDDSDRNIIMETFSHYWYDATETPDTRVEVIQRRQTANIPSEANLFALGNFVSFYADEISLLNANLMTPLSNGTFSRYRFEIADRTTLDGQLVYVITVIPTTRVLPAFEGTMKIVKGTYALVDIDVKPTGTTAIAFVRDLRFRQRFEQLADSVWYPTLLEVDGGVVIEVVKGIAVINATFGARSIFTEAAVNVSLPDTVFANQEFITAAPNADSARTAFWEGNSLSELTDKEKETYQRIDSLVAIADTTSAESDRTFSVEARPDLAFNRVLGLKLGGQLAVEAGPVEIGLAMGYALSLRRPILEANISLPLLRGESSLALFGSGFSNLASGYFDRSYPQVFNSLSALFFHRDYYDWHRQLGWRAGVRASVLDIRLEAAYQRAEQFAEADRVGRSLFVSKPLRANPLIVPGRYEVLSATMSWGRSEGAIAIMSGASTEAGFTLNGIRGRRDQGEWFSAIEGRAFLELPTIPTGYVPMTLQIAIQGGISSDSLPLQYQFRQRTGLVLISPFGHFMTAPMGVYGGDRYYAAHAEHNFTDFVWRWIGLPTYEGRGLELIVSAAAGKWEDDASTFTPSGRESGGVETGEFPVVGRYFPTLGRWYAEAGVGLGKIPTFVSNLAFLRFDARMGIGELAEGNWGIGLTLSSPF